MKTSFKYAESHGVHTFSLPFAEKELIIQIGKLAGQADGSCTLQYGETVVLATVVKGSDIREGIDYFPLMVDYDEKLYAAGKIKGSRFIKREGRPSDEAVLLGRLIDRSIRPFFNQETRNDVQVVVTTLSWDGENDPDILGVIAASVVLHYSDIEWDGPIAAVRLNYLDNQWVVNASYKQRTQSTLDLLVSVRENKVVMVEADGSEVPDELVTTGIIRAIDEAQPVLDFINYIREHVGVQKAAKEVKTGEQASRYEYIKKQVHTLSGDRVDQAFSLHDKAERDTVLEKLHQEIENTLAQDADVTKEERGVAHACVEAYIKSATKDLYLKHKRRIDGRAFDEVRALSVDVGLLPRTHGSGLFQRGETQVLSVLTLGAPSDEQILDSMEENDTKKRYMHHYNFPAFSVGEVRPQRGPGRRDIGHGALAEKALERMMPSKEQFPYTIRIVSEVLSSNGSTSQAAICGSTLALMDAGVPIKEPVAGIAMGIVTDSESSSNHYAVLTDIQGVEDHYGEMDFKIAGTRNGITAIQLDVKNRGITPEMVTETITQARTARLTILQEMTAVIAQPRPELSPYAPRIYTLRINPEKIGDVIGPRGKVINEIIEATGVSIDIEDDGLVMITSTDAEAADKAIEWVKNITREVVSGEVFQGTVTRIMDFGAFVEVLPQQEGLVHISELAPYRVERVTDIVRVGDVIPVKVTEIDSMGRINLSLKQTDYQYPPHVLHAAEKQQNTFHKSSRDKNKRRNDSRFNN